MTRTVITAAFSGGQYGGQRPAEEEGQMTQQSEPTREPTFREISNRTFVGQFQLQTFAELADLITLMSKTRDEYLAIACETEYRFAGGNVAVAAKFLRRLREVCEDLDDILPQLPLSLAIVAELKTEASNISNIAS